MTYRLALLLLLASPLRAEPVSGLKAPDGFEVTLFADDDLAHDIYSMTLNSQGKVVVSGAGYVKTLLDTDGDGVADTARRFADGPKTGAQGMCFNGTDLICTGDAGLIRYRDANRDGIADGPPEPLLKMKAGGEHHAHAVRKGPDGWWYVLAGNDTGVDETFITLKTSPVKKPEAGVLMRISPDFQDLEVVSHGYRNAYDFAIHPSGEMFVYDSDGERDVSLPWYRPTRVFQAVPGSHAGWVSRSWKRPNYYPDMPPVVGSFGRGSPTGVECYRHVAFPEPYRDAIFIADWTFGRVIALPLQSDGDVFRCEKPIEFLTGIGDHGFAPTDLVVAPDGSLFVSVGGRGTRGGVYRVRWTKDKPKQAANPKALYPVLRFLLFRNLDLATHRTPRQDSRKAQRPNWEPGRELTLPLLADEGLWWGRFEYLAELLQTTEPNLARRPALAIIRRIQLDLGGMGPRPDDPHPPVFDGYTARLDWKQTKIDGEDDAAYLERFPDRPVQAVAKLFPTRDPVLNHELARLLAMLEANGSGILQELLNQITAESHPIEDIHYLICTARMPAERTVEQRAHIAKALVGLEPKLKARQLPTDSNWEPRISEMYAAHVRLDPQLPAAVIQQTEFGEPGHVLFLKGASAEAREHAVEAFVHSIRQDANYPWTPELVALLGRANDAATRALIRRQFDNLGIRDAVLRVLARRPVLQDREKFVTGLESADLAVIDDCLDALAALPASAKPAEQFALVQLARRLGPNEPESKLRERAVALLERNLGQDFGRDISQWSAYLEEHFPETAAQFTTTGTDWERVRELMAQSDWTSGDAQRGRKLFEVRACARCHGSRRALGPDLAGVAKRFARDDLFTAIAAPDRDVSPRYATTAIVTTEGKTYTGLVIYESVDGILLREASGETIRVERDQIEAVRKLPKSLMPGGLLKDLTPQDLADLDAYLRQQ